MDIPADVISGIALGGAVAGGLSMKLFEKLGSKAEKGLRHSDDSRTEYLLGEMLGAIRENGETQRQSRDLLTEMRADHRVLEMKLDQIANERR